LTLSRTEPRPSLVDEIGHRRIFACRESDRFGTAAPLGELGAIPRQPFEVIQHQP
jgi:hypothetical protein